ncbi:hypothetical protein CPB84DRAFT_1851718 [Gymnopilus junonius]|uniref:Uncharacterized protein n=1 Tax=Gymnopilus junonius TaxID=109634 RepID=A0A9P5NEL9_GYMJU|nr:hypothetical protein CPB84DRAFT_1851718 [Gymnopilus junonius]
MAATYNLNSNSPSYFEALVMTPTKSSLDLARKELIQLANTSDRKIESMLGLNSSGRIVLDIIKFAQRAKSHRKECSYIADQAFQLVNAVDGGVKGRAIDVNDILRDHIAHLNEDLAEIRKVMKRFSSWMIVLRSWSAPRKLQRCHDILQHAMQTYLLLLRCSISQPVSQAPHYRTHAASQQKSSTRGRRGSTEMQERHWEHPHQMKISSHTLCDIPAFISDPQGAFLLKLLEWFMMCGSVCHTQLRSSYKSGS